MNYDDSISIIFAIIFALAGVFYGIGYGEGKPLKEGCKGAFWGLVVWFACMIVYAMNSPHDPK